MAACLRDGAEAFVVAAPRELHGWAIIKASRRGGPAMPDCLGMIGKDRRSEPLAITRLLLLFHLLGAV